MPLIFQKRIYRADLRATFKVNPRVIYVFGDNEDRIGLGGQAGEMRGEPNAHGVATLAGPGRFWREDDTDRQCRVLDQDMATIFHALTIGNLVIFPLDGIGTGIAELERRAPSTFAYLQRLLERAGAIQ